MKKKKNLKKLLNLGLLDYTNLTPKYGELDMPYIRCRAIPEIDFLATYSQPSTYFYSQNTCVSFLSMIYILTDYTAFGMQYIMALGSCRSFILRDFKGLNTLLRRIIQNVAMCLKLKITIGSFAREL